MKHIIKMAALAAAILATGAHAAQLDKAHSHVTFTMACRWLDEDGKTPISEAQTYTAFEDWNKAQWIEITPAKDAVKGMKPPTYIKTVEGSFSGKDTFKEFYWMGADTRMTLLRTGKTARVIIESITSPGMPVSEAACDNIQFKEAAQ